MNKIFTLTTRKIAGNTLYQLIGKVFTLGVTVFITYMITNHYGREDYGGFSLMQNFPGLLFVITDFGLNAISVREATKNESRLYHYFINVLVFRIFLSLLFIIFLSVLLYFFPYSTTLKLGIRLSLFLILTFSLFTSTNIIFQTKLRYDLSSISQIVGYFFIILLSVFLIDRHASIVWLSFSYVIGGFITFLVGWIFIQRLDISKGFFLDFRLIKSLFMESLPLGIMFVFSQMSFKEDSILLSILRIPSWLNLNSSEVVGIYSLPYKIFEVSLVIPTFVMNSVYPFLVEHFEEGASRFILSFKRTLLFLFVSGVVVGVFGVIFAPLIIKIFGVSEFAFSVPILRILMGGVFIFFLTQPVSWFLVILRSQKFLPRVYLISAVLNLVLNLVFIPIYSFYAAAVITLVTELVIFTMLCFYSYKA